MARSARSRRPPVARAFSWTNAASALLGSLLVSMAQVGAARAQADHAADGARGRFEGAEVTDAGLVYTVQSGDTLSEIAERLGVTVVDLMRWNPDLAPDRIRSGQRLRVESGQRRVEHVVQTGESLSLIAARYEVRVDELMRWNRRLNRDRVRAGHALTVFTRVPESRSASVGTPQRGRLEQGRPLPSRHPAIFVRTPGRAYGTDETVRWIVEAFEGVRATLPEAPRVEVHDLSFRRGGSMHGHHSHESGRDADIAYFQRQCGELCRFRRIGPDQLDVAAQWRLLSQWLESDRVEAIFVDYDLQRPLYEHARAQGVDRRDLSRWFQYPRDIDDRYGVIRHHPRHADHLHVRFVCHDTDPDCR